MPVMARQTLSALGVDIVQLLQQLRKRQASSTVAQAKAGTPHLSSAVQEVLATAAVEAKQEGLYYTSTKHLLSAIVQRSDSIGVQLLHQVRCTAAEVRSPGLIDNPPKRLLPRAFSVSPIFIGLLLLTIGAGYATYARLFVGTWPVFWFVSCGWLVTVTLHEFAHALVAYWAGDHTMIAKGYLSLNPFRYLYWFYSLLVPLLFLIAGGFALPGGAMYVNYSAIQRPTTRTLIGAAGVLCNLLFALLLGLPFLLGLHQANWPLHLEFWSGLALLIWFEVVTILVCLIPLPGTDGYVMIYPYLPRGWHAALGGIGGYASLILWYLYTQVPVVHTMYLRVIQVVTTQLNIDPFFIFQGWAFFRFWSVFSG